MSANRITSLPPEISDLGELQSLHIDSNQISWLPFELTRLPAGTVIRARNNPFAGADDDENCRPRLREHLAKMTALGMIRRRAVEVCLALQRLQLPALVTLKIINAMCPNKIRMAAKWDLITAVKHFHDRRAAAAEAAAEAAEAAAEAGEGASLAALPLSAIATASSATASSATASSATASASSASSSE